MNPSVVSGQEQPHPERRPSGYLRDQPTIRVGVSCTSNGAQDGPHWLVRVAARWWMPAYRSLPMGTPGPGLCHDQDTAFRFWLRTVNGELQFEPP
jgi:hypothetical protein